MNLLIGTAEGLFKRGSGGKVARAGDVGGAAVRYTGRLDGALYAGTEKGIYRSTDGGGSWQLRGAEGRLVWEIAATSDPRTLFAVAQPVSLWRSGDGGESWDEVSSLLEIPGSEAWCLPGRPPTKARARTIVLDRTRPERCWVGIEVGGVARTEDGGKSWSLHEPGNNPDIHVLAGHPQKPDTVFATTGYGRLNGVAEMVEGNAGFLWSGDGGETWEYRWYGMLPRYTRPMCVDQRQPYALTLTCAPTAFSSFRDDGGSQAMIYQTPDEGKTWQSLCDEKHSPSTANFHCVTPDPETVSGVLVGTDTGEVWRISPRAEWTLLADGLPMVQALLPLEA
jgi:hypothetical protein